MSIEAHGCADCACADPPPRAIMALGRWQSRRLLRQAQPGCLKSHCCRMHQRRCFRAVEGMPSTSLLRAARRSASPEMPCVAFAAVGTRTLHLQWYRFARNAVITAPGIDRRPGRDGRRKAGALQGAAGSGSAAKEALSAPFDCFALQLSRAALAGWRRNLLGQPEGSSAA